MKYYDSMGNDVTAYVAELEAQVAASKKAVAIPVPVTAVTPKTDSKKTRKF